MAFDPLPIHERIGGADIEGIVADGNLLRLPSRIAEMLRPVIEVIDLQPEAGLELGRTLAGRGQGEDPEIFVVGDQPLGTDARRWPCNTGSW